MATIHEWRSSTTHPIEYRLLSREFRRRIPALREPPPCRLLGAFTAGDRGSLFAAPCFTCSGFCSPEQYFQFCKEQLISRLRSRFPDVPGSCAGEIADSLREIVESANATDRCPSLGHRVTFATTHVVAIRLREADRTAIEESFQEAARLKPADKESVTELFKARDDVDDDKDKEGDRFESPSECVICLEEMETRKTALTMPCSHSFHEDCLVKWLDANHVCPLCRYELPAAKN